MALAFLILIETNKFEVVTTEIFYLGVKRYLGCWYWEQ